MRLRACGRPRGRPYGVWQTGERGTERNGRNIDGVASTLLFRRRNPLGKLQDKVAIVTGASSGIGLAIAKALGRESAAVVLPGRPAAPMEKAADEIAANSGRALVRRVDVRDEKQVRDLVDSAVKEFGKLDVMVNNAGVNPFDNVIEGDVERWRETLETNVIGVALGCREAYRVMKGKGPGGGGERAGTSSTSPASPPATPSRTGRCTRRPSMRRAP